uniref:Uncharacterized protein n=1 Tax=Arundo donax TaxID=35708 RepID=A0A0A9CGB0_ARUDO
MKDDGEAPPSNARGPSNMQPVEARMDVNGIRSGPKRKLTEPGRGGKKLRVPQAPRQRPELSKGAAVSLHHLQCDVQ